MKNRILGLLGLSAVTAGIQQVFALQLWSCGLIWLTGILFLPWIFRWLERGRRAKEEYYEMTTYMEQLLCSYRRLGKLSPALEDCISLFSADSPMGQALRRAKHMLKTGEGVVDGELVRGALACIGGSYASRRLLLLHEFLERAERVGGESEEALDILLHDLQMWKKRTTLYQKKKQFIRAECGVALLLAGGLCGLSRLLFPLHPGERLIQSLVYQITTMVFVIALFVVEAMMICKLTGTWLDTREISGKKERRQLKREYAIVQRKGAGIRRSLAKRICQLEVEREFPYWLLSVTLYLQQESVFLAISRSLEHLQGIFRTEVKRLRRCIYENPSGLSPFTEFFHALELPEVQTGMKLLYSVNYSGYQEAGGQIRFLVEQNNLVMDKCESRRFENQAAGLGMLKQIPMALASIKVVVDMILFLAITMNDSGML